ncbi:hypothetical protein B0H13DRAFT_2234162 [Mycena leptocephala]|nr:hypothetical protein B0H13DRAFT_2234162 [Mycena leptocephala]
MSDQKGKEKLSQCMEPHLLDFACDTVAEQMETRRKKSILPGIEAITPAFTESWNLDEQIDHSPFLSQILETAAQTERAKLYNKKKKPDKILTSYSDYFHWLLTALVSSFQAAFGLFLWSTGSARQTIDAAFRCGLSVCLTADGCMEKAIQMAKDPHSFNYDNMNISRSIFVEQHGTRGPAKVTSGTFGILYGLRNAKWEDMLIGPIMKRFQACACTGLQFNRDIRPSLDSLHSYHDQLVIVVVHTLGKYSEEFGYVTGDADLQHRAQRPIPVGYKTPQGPVRASTTEEATMRGNLQFHDEVYIDQLKRDHESLSKYIFQLGFGLFHLCLNLVWAILHVHRGSVNEAGSLAYFFLLMEKARLGNDQPDYHTLLAALMQVLDGLLLDAWKRECGFPNLTAFAESKPTPKNLREIAAQILTNYATPMADANTTDPDPVTSDAESTDSASSFFLVSPL